MGSITRLSIFVIHDDVMKWKKCLFIILSNALFLALIELLLALALHLIDYPRLFETDSNVGYRLRPNLDVTQRKNGIQWKVRTDSFGRRIGDDHPLSASLKPKVVLLGDSFGFGYGVESDEAVSSVLSREGFQVVNLSVPGYGTNQQLFVLQEFLEKNKADFVITLTFSNDINDIVSTYKNMRHRPAASSEFGQLNLHPFEPPWTDHLLDHSAIFALLRYGFQKPKLIKADGYEAVTSCLIAIDQVARTHDCLPLFFLHDANQPNFFDKMLNKCRAKSLAIEDLSMALNKQLHTILGPDKFHWNKEGHQLAGELIVSSIRRFHNEKLLPVSGSTANAPPTVETR